MVRVVKFTADLEGRNVNALVGKTDIYDYNI
jgi:hypothetical protein